MPDSGIVVRRIEEGDWGRLRAIRLEALGSAPDAFLTTVAEAEAHPESLWRERAAMGAAGDTQITVLAVRGDDTPAMAVGLWRSPEGAIVVPIVAVFVAQRARRTGIGSRVMADVEAWASGRGAERTSLWVVEGNDGARRFYESIGYRATLDRQKIMVPPVRWETRMEKDLVSRRA